MVDRAGLRVLDSSSVLTGHVSSAARSGGPQPHRRLVGHPVFDRHRPSAVGRGALAPPILRCTGEGSRDSAPVRTELRAVLPVGAVVLPCRYRWAQRAHRGGLVVPAALPGGGRRVGVLPPLVRPGLDTRGEGHHHQPAHWIRSRRRAGRWNRRSCGRHWCTPACWLVHRSRRRWGRSAARTVRPVGWTGTPTCCTAGRLRLRRSRWWCRFPGGTG